jgi:DNA polymerase III delta subunit
MGEHPLVVVTMLARHCRQTLIAIEGLRARKNPRDIASEAQIPPFAMDQFLAGARAVNPDTVRKMYIRLAEIDRQLKSTSLDGRALLEGLICEFV